MEHFHSKRLKKGHSEQDKLKPSIVFFVASMLQRAQGMIGKFLSPVSTRDQICFITNVAFVLKISLFQFGFSRKTVRKQAHLVKRKGRRKCQRKSSEKVKANDEDTKPRGRKIAHGSNLRRSKTRCDVKSVVFWL